MITSHDVKKFGELVTRAAQAFAFGSLGEAYKLTIRAAALVRSHMSLDERRGASKEIVAEAVELMVDDPEQEGDDDHDDYEPTNSVLLN